MQPLKTVKETLVWLSICKPPESTSKSKRIACILCSVLVFVGNVWGLVGHLAYIFKIGSNDPEGSVFAFMGSVGFISSNYILVSVFVFRYRIRVIFEHLAQIYASRKFNFAILKQWTAHHIHLHAFSIFLVLVKNTDLMKYLLRANNTSEWMCQLYLKYFAIVIGCNLVLIPTSALVSRLSNGYFDVNSALHMSKIMLAIFIVQILRQ